MKNLICIVLLWILIPTMGALAGTKDVDVVPVNPHPAFDVEIWLDKSVVNPGQTISVSFRSQRDCYLTLIDHGSSGNVTIIYPNPWSGNNNFVAANKVYTFPPPGASFEFKISGPVGIESILAYATLTPNTIGQRLGLSKSIGNRQFKSINQGVFKDIVVEDSRRAGQSDWVTARHNFQVGSAGGGYPLPAPSLGGTAHQNTTPQQTDIVSNSIFYILSVGASTGSLRGCEVDAREFVRVMSTNLGIPGNQIKLITGSSADLDGIRQGFNWLRQNMGPNDTAIFYFSGHGSYVADKNGDESDGYDEVLIPYGFSVNDISTVLIDDELNQWLKKLPGRHVAVVDACHSGTITKEFTGGQSKFFQGGLLGVPNQGGTLVVKALDAQQEFGRSLLAATKENLSALEKDGRGLFTAYFCQAIESGAGSLSEAFKTTRRKVLQISSNQQDPVLTDPQHLAENIKFNGRG